MMLMSVVSLSGKCCQGTRPQ